MNGAEMIDSRHTDISAICLTAGEEEEIEDEYALCCPRERGQNNKGLHDGVFQMPRTPTF